MIFVTANTWVYVYHIILGLSYIGYFGACWERKDQSGLGVGGLEASCVYVVTYYGCFGIAFFPMYIW
jgi:hypothetical protein